MLVVQHQELYVHVFVIYVHIIIPLVYSSRLNFIHMKLISTDLNVSAFNNQKLNYQYFIIRHNLYKRNYTNSVAKLHSSKYLQAR